MTSTTLTDPALAIQPLQRAVGRARLGLKRVDGATRIADLHQEGTAKIKFPNVDPGAPLEAVLINTGGGMTGGDRFSTEIDLAPATRAVLTTQACEKVYRARDGVVEARNRVTIRAGAALDWVPQETILFDRGALDRRLDVDMAADARLLAVEAMVLGRTGMGETVTRGTLREAFRIRREGRLVFADAFRLEGEVESVMARPATGGGARAFATLLLVAPEAESRVESVRAMMEGWDDAGATTLPGLLVVRLLAVDGAGLRRRLVVLLGHLGQGALPRVWST